MGTEVLSTDVCCPPSPSSSFSSTSSSPSNLVDRPFKIIVQTQTFLIDAENMRQLSPIFSIMCFGKDFDKMDEYHREIVDEKSGDVGIFLDAIQDHSLIGELMRGKLGIENDQVNRKRIENSKKSYLKNLPVILRLANKYQVDSVIDACEDFVRRQNLDILSTDEVLTIVIACHEFHSSKDVVVKLIRRLANEEKTTFNRLKLSRRLPAQIYGAVIGANLNLCQIREVGQMNGHWLRTVGSRARWYRAPCEFCKQITDCANCDTCRKTMCRDHVAENKCPDSYGTKMLKELKENIVELEWD
ncbi:unnamed protein product, partial [Mesorhabditis belari]|uniref:BTB domain-containing protein n=1 Tax=Mesorhabditis belari TaxID=2138241 RepID=A0AAF3EUF0_9BILA